MSRRVFGNRKGSALLAVLWLSLALTAIAFTLSRTVRSELDRSSLNVDSARAYFLARGGIERTMLRMLRPRGNDQDDDSNIGFRIGQRWMTLPFPEGDVVVEIVSENGKINVNTAPPEVLTQVFIAAGLDPSYSSGTATRIAGARGASQQQLLDPRDDDSSLSRRPASFKELEELLVLPGITTDVLYGTYGMGPAGGWVKTGGLHRHISIFGSTSVDANYASPEVLRAAGLPAGQIASLLELRELRPLRPEDLGDSLMLDQSGPIRVTAGGGGTAYTLWSRATLHNGRARRAVGALIERSEKIGDPPLRIVRWYDSEF